jgi:hypothetical protein
MRRPGLNQCPISIVACLLLVACGKQDGTRSRSEELTGREVRPVENVSRNTAGPEQRRAELLNRIRAADPEQATIVRALINDKNELGLVLNRQTDLDEVPKLMRAMLVHMEKSFPGEDHTVVAYTPTNPPRAIGTGRSDARTRKMTYTPASAP